MSNPNKIILSLLGAAVAGLVIGILLSPEKGGEIRKKIADKASDIAARIGEMLSTGKEKVEDQGESLV
jgi:gas vesicle protein